MKVIVFDGDCTLCNRLVRLIVKWNRNPNLKITSFDSEWAKMNVPSLVGQNSMVFVDGDYYKHSGAVIRALASMNHYFMPFKLLLIIPDVLRDDLYKFVARNRNKVKFSSSCPAPTDKYREMYLS